MPDPVILEFPAMTVVGLETRFRSILSNDPEAVPVIPQLWHRFIHRIQDVPHYDGNESCGLVSMLPEADRNHPHELLYLAGVPVNKVDEVPEGMTVREIPPATWAVFVHHGPMSRILETVEFAYRHWLPDSGYRQVLGIPDVELYDQRFQDGGEKSVMEYRIAITRGE